MRDPQRIYQLTDRLGYLWKTCMPDWRFGQLLAYLAAQTDIDPFYVEDDQWYSIIGSTIDKALTQKGRP